MGDKIERCKKVTCRIIVPVEELDFWVKLPLGPGVGNTEHFA
jgi:hypothetical protein